MKGIEIFEKITDLKERFKNFFQHKKQLAALENHSLVQRFNENEQEVFSAIKYCMKGSFLEEEDADWIGIKLNRLKINYLDWAHKTKWLKQQIVMGQRRTKPVAAQMFLDLKPHNACFNVPIELLAKTQNQRTARI